MSIDLTSSMNRLTDLYLNPDSYSKSIENSIGSSLKTGEEAKEKFGPTFSEVYDSLQVMRSLDDVMRSKYETDHKNDDKTSLSAKSSAMTFSKGSSRIMDMLSESISESMNEKVNTAMKNALDNL